MRLNDFSVLAFLMILILFFASCKDFDDTVSDGTTDEPDPVPGVIESIDKTEAYIDDTVTISGVDFRANETGEDYILFDTIEVYYPIKWEDDRIVMKVPQNIHFGDISISVMIDDTMSNKINLKVLQPDLPPVEMVEIPAGSFLMGDIAGTGFDNELPLRNVTISKSFMMSKYEVSQPQWKALVSNNRSLVIADSLPVSSISWWEAVIFCNRLSEREGLEPCYSGFDSKLSCDFDANGYRLPTEAEWEYACRAGAGTIYFFGSDTSGLTDAAWYETNRDDVSTSRPPGLKAPNSFGLYDIHGNLAEWCWDWWADKYNESDTLDPKGPGSGWGKVLRGGAWDSNAASCRSAFRYYNRPPDDLRVYYAGLRLVRSIN